MIAIPAIPGETEKEERKREIAKSATCRAIRFELSDDSLPPLRASTEATKVAEAPMTSYLNNSHLELEKAYANSVKRRGLMERVRERATNLLYSSHDQ